MTEKRYKMKCHEINSWYIEKDGKVLIFDLFKSDAEIIYNELNKLSDENEQLKQKNNELEHKYSLLLDENYKEVVSLEEENEQLKKENKMLKTTIGRNEAYINRLTNNGKWSNTSSGGSYD